MELPAQSGRAAKLTAQVARVAEPALTSGETVLIAVRVNMPNTVAATAAGATGTATGALTAADLLDAEFTEASDAGFPLDPQQALGLTDRSVVVTSRSSLSGKPNKFRCAVPLSEIRQVEHEDGRLGAKLSITMTTGTRVEYSCVKVDPGAQFAAEVNARVG